VHVAAPAYQHHTRCQSAMAYQVTERTIADPSESEPTNICASMRLFWNT
jgi:hypothetical protein